MFRSRRVLSAAPLAALLVAASPALADESAAGVTVSVAPRAVLAARVQVTVPVTVTCQPLAPLPATASVILVDARQAVVHGSQIATGVGLIGPQSAGDPNPLVCDRLPHRYPIEVPAEAHGPPFRVGPALLLVTAAVCTSPFQGCTSASITQAVRFVRAS